MKLTSQVSEVNIMLPWKPDDVCPCGSGKALKDCCLELDGIPRIRIPNLAPPGKITHYSNEKCYLKVTRNCSKVISKEHYISRSLLQQIGELRIIGFPWDKPGVDIKYGINSLTSYILCDRHNSALSPLDTLAAAAFKALLEWREQQAVKFVSRDNKWFLVSGEAIELWGFKTLCGLFYSSVAARNKESLVNAYSLDVDRFITALQQRRLAAGCGLYHTSHTGKRDPVALAPLSVEDCKKVIGIRIALYPLEFDIILDPTGVNFEYLKRNFYYRPWVINLISQYQTDTLFFSWPNSLIGSPIVDIRLSMDEPDGPLI